GAHGHLPRNVSLGCEIPSSSPRCSLWPNWHVEASLEVYDKLEKVPADHWPLIIKKDIGIPGALAIHETNKDSPFALVEYVSDMDQFTLAISQVLLNMVVNPFGKHIIEGLSPDPAQKGKKVELFVEISAPVESKDCGYRIGNTLVSDFVLPQFFTGEQSDSHLKYSYNDCADEPRQPTVDGYQSWRDDKGDWFQTTWFGQKPEIRSLGNLGF